MNLKCGDKSNGIEKIPHSVIIFSINKAAKCHGILLDYTSISFSLRQQVAL